MKTNGGPSGPLHMAALSMQSAVLENLKIIKHISLHAIWK